MCRLSRRTPDSSPSPPRRLSRRNCHAPLAAATPAGAAAPPAAMQRPIEGGSAAGVTPPVDDDSVGSDASGARPGCTSAASLPGADGPAEQTPQLSATAAAVTSLPAADPLAPLRPSGHRSVGSRLNLII